MVRKLSKSPLASNIIRLRHSKDWSQAELAHRVGVHLNTIKNIEGCHNEGTHETRVAIAQALGVSVSQLYEENHKPKAEPTQHNFVPDWAESARILNALATAPPHRRLAALYLLTKDESYLDQLRELPAGAQFARALSKAL